jgi:hypothetical protein
MCSHHNFSFYPLLILPASIYQRRKVIISINACRYYFFNLSLNTFSNFSSLGCITILQ